jgi:hypothetical protein
LAANHERPAKAAARARSGGGGARRKSDPAAARTPRRPHLAEVAGVELVHQDAVVVLPSRISAAAGVLAVLAHAAVARADVPPLLPVLPEPCERAERATKAVGAAGGGQARHLEHGRVRAPVLSASRRAPPRTAASLPAVRPGRCPGLARSWRSRVVILATRAAQPRRLCAGGKRARSGRAPSFDRPPPGDARAREGQPSLVVHLHAAPMMLVQSSVRPRARPGPARRAAPVKARRARRTTGQPSAGARTAVTVAQNRFCV